MICMISIAVVCACCGTDVLYIMSLPARLLSMCALKKCQQIQALRMHYSGPKYSPDIATGRTLNQAQDGVTDPGRMLL